MADINATFNYEANLGSAISQFKLLARELSNVNNSFNSLDKNARVLRNDIASTFTAAAGSIGGFSTKTVDITSNLDNFGRSLDRSKLKLRDYYREATRAFNANSNARKLAEDQVRRTKAQLVELGMDGAGRRKGVLVTPMRLDMSEMQNQLDVARKQFDIFNRLVQDGATHLINWGKNTQWAGRQLTVGLTVPMTIFASTTIKAFNDVDKELTRFQKVYGSDLVQSVGQSTNAIRGQVQALAIDIAKQYGIAVKETAGLAADLAATGLEGEKLMDSVKQTTRLAVLGEVDRQEAMKTTLSLQNAFNMSTKELADSINFLNAVENQTSVSLQDLTEAIPKVGPVVNALGGDVKDLSVLLVAMKEGGINAAEGANALKSGLASMINPTKSASEVAMKFGVDLQGIVKANRGELLPTMLAFQKSLQNLDEFGRAQIIEQLFGKYQFARISALFDNLNAQGSQTIEVMKLMGASTEELAKIADGEIKTLTESTSMRFQRAMESIKAAMLPVGEAITRSVIPYMEKFANAVGKIIEFGQGLPEPVKNLIKFATGITAIAGPMIMVTGVLANFLGYVTKGAMGFVNLGRRMAGMPTKQFSLLDDEQIAAAQATEVLTTSINKQSAAMANLITLMKDYGATLIAQRNLTPAAFGSMPVTSTISGKPVVPSNVKTLPVIKRQTGSWVPGTGSGDKVPAMLEPGEFVVNRNAAKQYGGFLENINSGIPRFIRGSAVQNTLNRFTRGNIDSLSDLKLTYERSSNPIRDFSREKSTHNWKSKRDEKRAILLKARELRRQGIELPYETVKDMLSIDASHTNDPGSRQIIQGVPVKAWAREFLFTDYGAINKAVNNNKYSLRSLARQNPDKFGNLVEMTASGFDVNHPMTNEEASLMLEALKLIESSDRNNINRSTKYASIGAALLEERLKLSSAENFYSTLDSRRYLTDKVGYTTSVSRDRANNLDSRESREGMVYRPGSGSGRGGGQWVQQQGYQRASNVGAMGAQSGAWVSGTGSGDRVPALLEPGEFVVNKNAAKQYGSMLEDINFRQAPRFRVGGSTLGAISAGSGALGSIAFMAPMFMDLSEGMQKAIGVFATLTTVVSGVTGTMQMLANRTAAAGGESLFARGASKRESGLQAIRGKGMISKVGGVGRLAMGALMSGPGLAVAGTVGIAAAAVIAYRKSVEAAGKAGTAAFSASAKTAELYGVQVQSVNDKIKENQKLTRELGLSGAVNVSSQGVTEEQRQGIISGQDQFIKGLTGAAGSAFTRAFTDADKKGAPAKQAAMFKAQFATLLQQGLDPNDIMEILTVSAEEAGEGALDTLRSIKPQLTQLAKTPMENIYEVTQQAQLDALRDLARSSNLNNGRDAERYKKAFEEVFNNIQFAPPEDQAEAMSKLLKEMASFDSKEIKVASDALKEMTKGTVIGDKVSQLTMGNSAEGLRRATELALAQNLGMDQKKLELLVTADTKTMDAQLQSFFQTRGFTIEAYVKLQSDLSAQIEEKEKQILAEEAAYQSALANNEELIDKENERYKNAGKKHREFIKQRQKEIQVINDQASKEIDSIQNGTQAYLDALNKKDQASKFESDQRGTIFGGLAALGEGDVLGFLEAQQNAEDAARNYSIEQEINSIEEKRDAEIKAIEDQRNAQVEAKELAIEKQEELAEKEDEAHENNLKKIEAARQAIVNKYSSDKSALNGYRKEVEALTTIQGNPALTSWISGFSNKADQAAYLSAAVNYLTSTPGATAEQALTSIRATWARFGKENRGTVTPLESTNRRESFASGGYVSGPGTPTSDSIPAMLSNGEYVIKASSVKKFGKDSLDKLNNGQPVEFYADGGFVMPTRSGRNSNNYGAKGPLWSLGYHTGLDFAGENGTDILSVGDGYVESLNSHGSAYGKHVTVRHNKDLISMYAHLSKILVGVGDRISKGQHIGEMGATGNTTGTHLHLEMGRGSYKNAVNPLKYLLGASYAGGTEIDTGNLSLMSEKEAISAITAVTKTSVGELKDIMEKGSGAVYDSFGARRFGGSMTANKPYVVGENGPEIVVPYGSGQKVMPKFNVANADTSVMTIPQNSGGIINNASMSNTTINLSVNGITDPDRAANRVIEIINEQTSRRSHGRGLSGR